MLWYRGLRAFDLHKIRVLSISSQSDCRLQKPKPSNTPPGLSNWRKTCLRQSATFHDPSKEAGQSVNVSSAVSQLHPRKSAAGLRQCTGICASVLPPGAGRNFRSSVLMGWEELIASPASRKYIRARGRNFSSSHSTFLGNQEPRAVVGSGGSPPPAPALQSLRISRVPGSTLTSVPGSVYLAVEVACLRSWGLKARSWPASPHALGAMALIQ